MPLSLSINTILTFWFGTISKSLNSNMLYGIEIEKNGWPAVCCPISLTSINEISWLSDNQSLIFFASIFWVMRKHS